MFLLSKIKLDFFSGLQLTSAKAENLRHTDIGNFNPRYKRGGRVGINMSKVGIRQGQQLRIDIVVQIGRQTIDRGNS